MGTWWASLGVLRPRWKSRNFKSHLMADNILTVRKIGSTQVLKESIFHIIFAVFHKSSFLHWAGRAGFVFNDDCEILTRYRTPDRCRLPHSWTGEWFESGVPGTISLSASNGSIQHKGKCVKKLRVTSSHFIFQSREGEKSSVQFCWVIKHRYAARWSDRNI